MPEENRRWVVACASKKGLAIGAVVVGVAKSEDRAKEIMRDIVQSGKYPPENNGFAIAVIG